MKKEEPSIGLMRHLLGGIDLSDVEEEIEMSEEQRREYCASISAVFPRLEKDIKKFLYGQLMFSANQSETWEQVLFGRGSFNGMSLLLEHWRKAHIEYSEKSQQKEEFNKHEPIAEI